MQINQKRKKRQNKKGTYTILESFIRLEMEDGRCLTNKIYKKKTNIRIKSEPGFLVAGES